MKKTVCAILTTILAVVSNFYSNATDDVRLIRFPDINNKLIAFVYAGDIWTVNSSGGDARRLTSHEGLELFPKISPDGKWIAFSGEYSGSRQIFVMPSEGGVPRQLTWYNSVGIMPPRGGWDNVPLDWTPDSKQILFFSPREGKFGGIFRKQADGTGEDEKFVAAPDLSLYPWSLSSDGKTLVVMDTPDPYTRGDLSMLSMEGDHARKPLLNNPDFLETQARLSPDGKWLAYVSSESKRNEVYVRPFPDVTKGRWQVSTNGATAPLWSPNGRELFYLGEEEGAAMSVPVETGQAFSAGTPKKLFPFTPYMGGGSTPGTAWDIHPDGKRFLMMKLPGAAPSAPAGARKFIIVLNWFEELKQRAPVK